MNNSTAAPGGPALLADENSALVDNALDLMVVLDAEGRIQRVNAASAALLGYAPAELVGRHYNEVVHPEQHEEALGIEDSLRNEHPERPDLPLRVRRKDGRVVLMSVAARWSEPHQRMFLTARDVTGQEQARAALLRSEAALNAMLDSIGDAFFAVDADWRLTYANSKAGEFVGVEAGSVIGRDLLSVAPDLRQSPTLLHYRRAMETRQADTFEVFWAPRRV